MAVQVQEWLLQRDGTTYVGSTDKKHVSVDFIQEAFASEDCHWAKPLQSRENVVTMVENCCVIGLYVKSESGESEGTLSQIGMARFMTDYMTFAYLTDVYILPSYQGIGLGKWFMTCCQAFINSIPELRRAVLATSRKGPGVEFYKRELRMQPWEEALPQYVMMVSTKE